MYDLGELRRCLESIEARADAVTAAVNALRRGVQGDGARLEEQLRDLISAGTHFQEQLILAGKHFDLGYTIDTEWAEFLDHLESVASTNERRVQTIIEQLRAATIVSAGKRRQDIIRRSIDAALDELEATLTTPPGILGPEQGDWLGWWWSFSEAERQTLVDKLPERLARFADLLAQLRLEDISGEASAQPLAELNEGGFAMAGEVVATDASALPPSAANTTALATANEPTVSEEMFAPQGPSHEATLRAQAGVASALGSVAAQAFVLDVAASAAPASARGSDVAPGALLAPSKATANPFPKLLLDEPWAENALPKAGVLSVPVPVSSVPPELQRFDLFAEHYWSTARDTVEPVPWRHADFDERLEKALDGALALHATHAWLFARALQDRGHYPRVHPDDVWAVAEIMAAPQSPESGYAASRSERLGPLRRNETCQQDLRLTLFLEALRPTEPFPWASTEATAAAVESVGYRSASVRRLVDALCRVSCMGGSAVDSLRRAHKAADSASPDHLRRTVEDRRSKFQEIFQRNYHAAGGKIERTHCRKAWEEFIKTAHPKLQPLLPSEGVAPQREWDTAEIDHVLRSLERSYRQIADKYEAKYGDRHKMDRVVREIVGAAAEANQSLRRWETAQKQDSRGAGQIDVLTDCLKALLPNPPGDADSLEMLCTHALRCVVEPSRGPQRIVGLGLGVLLEHPALLLCMSVGDIASLASSPSLSEVVVPLESARDIERLAAVLLENPVRQPEANPSTAAEALLESIKAAGGEELESCILPLLTDRDQERARTAADARMQEAYDQISEIEACCRQLDDCAHGDAPWLRAVVRQAEHALQRGQGDLPPNPRLIREWLVKVREIASIARKNSEDSIRSRAKGTPHEAAVAQALNQRRLGEAFMLAGGHHPAEPEEVRATVWRDTAERKYGNPRTALGTLRARLRPQDAAVIDRWLESPKELQRKRQGLASAFAKLISDETIAGDTHGSATISASRLRAALVEGQFNPCFVPQISSWHEVAILVGSQQVTSANYPYDAATDAGKWNNGLVLLLAPGVAQSVRQRTIEEFHRRGVRAAILDDLDLVRLLHAPRSAPTPAIAAIEIALEQQPFRVIDPFGGHEGQQVKMEMYVGRRNEAKALAHSTQYSRLFSGRKLGKSALLRYVEEGVDSGLPSGNTLKVLYVPVVGIDSEAALADRVLAELRSRLNWTTVADASNAADRFVATLRQLLSAEPQWSLLFVLDEADVFVESQIEEYDRVRERCLTFRMRTDLESVRDSNGFPRVRFVFSGYRATQTRDGAWANWADVLVLAPLEPKDAQRLIAGPLARLGVDATAQAPNIAFRCGYQPAVLLRFGHVLLKELEQRRGRKFTDLLEVDARLVVDVFNDYSVQEEIVTVVQNNFQGNEFGALVFNALLCEFRSQPPGTSLGEIVDVVLERIDQVTQGSGWTSQDETMARGRVELAIRDLVARGLLEEERSGSFSIYRLAFPHHLPVLLRRDPEQQVRSRLHALGGGQGLGHAERPRALFPPQRLEVMRDIASGVYKDADVAAIVIGSLWAEALTHPHGGLAARLGLMEPGGTCGSRVLCDVSPESADAVLRAWGRDSDAKMLIGGAALLRWAAARAGKPGPGFEVFVMGRLSRVVVEWWFTRVHGLEFVEPSVVEQLYERTKGVPPLVRLLEESFDGKSGITLSGSQVSNAFARFDVGLDACIRWIRQQLTEREIQVLTMYCAASDHVQPNDDFWEWLLMIGDVQSFPWPKIGFADRLAIELLMDLGLVPSCGERSACLRLPLPLSADDPSRRVAVSPDDAVKG